MFFSQTPRSPDRVVAHAALAETWPSLQPRRPNGSHALKSIVYWEQVVFEEPLPANDNEEEWELCTDISLGVCRDPASSLFDMDQAADLARLIDGAFATDSPAPVHVRFLLPRDGETYRCASLDKTMSPSFKLVCRNWVWHLDDDLMVLDGGIKVVQKMLALLLCALGNSWDPAKDADQWTSENPRPELKIVGICSLVTTKNVIQAVSRSRDPPTGRI
jgi:hypothetical protein